MLKNTDLKRDALIGTKRFWFLMWGLGLAGQLCWNIENQWFNTFVYAKIAKDSSIVTLMVITSALVTTFSTFLFGTLSDRIGSRRRFVFDRLHRLGAYHHPFRLDRICRKRACWNRG